MKAAMEGDYCKDSVFASPHVNDLAKAAEGESPPKTSGRPARHCRGEEKQAAAR